MINSNQFRVSPTKGLVINKGGHTDVLSVKVATSQTDPLIVGDAVKIIDSISKLSEVVKATASDTDVFFIGYEATKANSYNAGDYLTVYGDYTIMIMEAGAAIMAGAKIAITSGAKITSATTGNVAGIALQKATKSGDLIQVKIKNAVLA